jgi:putative DNA primase/helicase
MGRPREAAALMQDDARFAAVEAEQAVLGALLAHHDAWERIDPVGLAAADFTDEGHAAIFVAVEALRARGAAVDPLTVHDELKAAGRDALAGGLQYLVQLETASLSPAHAAAHAAIVRDRAWRRNVDAKAKAIGKAAGGPLTDAELWAKVPELLAELQQLCARPGAAPPPFARVAVADLAQAEPAAPAYWWDGYIPAGLVTLLGAHGGVGKSLVSLMLAVCVALGLPLFGVPTRRGRVLYFSGEDGPDLMRHRLAWVCRHLQVNPADLQGWLHILDATSGEPVLFREVVTMGQRQWVTTQTYAALSDYFEMAQADLLIVDNASDVFDAPEIQRAAVRAFMRSLARIAQARGGAVLLLAHVDKATARGNAAGSDSYSGSTAWNNSAGSRLAMSRTADGGLRLEHQKLRVGRLREPLDLAWPEHGLPCELAPVGPMSRRLLEQSDTRALLTLLHEFYVRGEWVSTAGESRTNAARMLGGQRGYPKRRPFEVFNLLRDAERAGLVAREAWKGPDRKPRERWALTAAGAEFINAPPAQ